MIQDETEEAIKKRQVDLFVDLRKDGLHHDIALSFAGLPNVCQVVDTLAPLKISIQF